MHTSGSPAMWGGLPVLTRAYSVCGLSALPTEDQPSRRAPQAYSAEPPADRMSSSQLEHGRDFRNAL